MESVRGLIESPSLRGPDAPELVDRLWCRSLSLLDSHLTDLGERGVRISQLVSALRELRRAERDRLSEASPDRSAMPQLIEISALVQRRIAEVGTTEELLGEAPAWIAELGFDRVLVSCVSDDVWVPEAMFVRNDPAWGQDIMAAGREEPALIDGALVEGAVVDQGTTLVVEQVQANPRVHPAIARVSRSDNYGVVPLRYGEQVFGMLHADCYFQHRVVTSAELATLDSIAHAMAAAWRRTALSAHLDQLGTLISGRAAPVPGPGVPAPPAGGRPRSAGPIVPALTSRETDVMRLLANGETNYRIARLLGISEATAKTHVKNILAKLGVANRAEAVSRWLQLR